MQTPLQVLLPLIAFSVVIGPLKVSAQDDGLTTETDADHEEGLRSLMAVGASVSFAKATSEAKKILSDAAGSDGLEFPKLLNSKYALEDLLAPKARREVYFDTEHSTYLSRHGLYRVNYRWDRLDMYLRGRSFGFLPLFSAKECNVEEQSGLGAPMMQAPCGKKALELRETLVAEVREQEFHLALPNPWGSGQFPRRAITATVGLSHADARNSGSKLLEISLSLEPRFRRTLKEIAELRGASGDSGGAAAELTAQAIVTSRRALVALRNDMHTLAVMLRERLTKSMPGSPLANSTPYEHLRGLSHGTVATKDLGNDRLR